MGMAKPASHPAVGHDLTIVTLNWLSITCHSNTWALAMPASIRIRLLRLLKPLISARPTVRRKIDSL
jgi:hypothetical protein